MQNGTILAAHRTELVETSNDRELRQWIKNTPRSNRRQQLRDLEPERLVGLWDAVGTPAIAQLLDSVASREISRAVRGLPEAKTVELISPLPLTLAANV